MISRFLTLFLLGLLALPAFGQSLRSVVALVKPKLSEEARAGFNTIAASFADLGYEDLETYFQDLARGGHGSGVLLRAPSGQVVLVTNRHVAAFCETAEVSFRAADGTVTVWPDCPVVYTDPRVDIAVIAVPQSQKPVALRLKVDEGAEVWSAGYPGLAGRPEWQLAKGTITNASVVLPELGAEKDAVFYQHSASIDPGNSGGPLLVGDPAKPETFQVVAINSYSIRNRNNTYFSIPAGKIVEALQRFAEADKTEADPTRLTDFLNAAEWDKFAFRQLISYSYASSAGWDAFQKAARTMTTKDRTLWYDRFFASPLDALSQFLSYQLWKRVQAAPEPIRFVKKEDAGGPKAAFTLGPTPVEVGWVREAGSWKVGRVVWPTDAAPAARTAEASQGVLVPSGPALVLSGIVPVSGARTGDLGLGILYRVDSPMTGPFVSHWRLGFWQESPTGDDASLKTRLARLNLLEGGLGASYFHTTKFAGGGYIAAFGGVTGVLDFSLPMLQPGWTDAVYETEGSPFDTLLFMASVEPRAGVEISFDENWAFGIEAGVRWYALGLSGLKSVPISFTIKSTSLR